MHPNEETETEMEADGTPTNETVADETVTLELWVWADRDRLDASHDVAIDRAERLAANGVVDAFSLETWGHQVGLSANRPPSDLDHHVSRRLAAVTQWALTRGVEVPLPPVRRGGVGRMGPEVAVQDLPMVLMVEYVGDRVAFVSPCAVGGRGCSVEERLDRLADAGRWVAPKVVERDASTGT
jgi:hypothetical protein